MDSPSSETIDEKMLPKDNANHQCQKSLPFISCSSGLVHVLRCCECGFETIVRDRFDTHNPCANTVESFRLYTCSRCGACSTSQTLMNEHGELCHPEQTYLIEESMEPFKPTHKQSSSASNNREKPSAALKAKPNISSPNEKLCTTQASGPLNESLNNETYGSAFKEFMNQVNAFGKQMSKEFLSSIDSNVPLTSIGNELICPVCNQSLGLGSREDLFKHLAFVHLLPLPSIPNYLTATASALQTGQETSHLARLPFLSSLTPSEKVEATREWYTSQSNIMMSPPLYPIMGNASNNRATERNLKKDLNSEGQLKRTEPSSFKNSNLIPAKDDRSTVIPNLTCPQCSASFSNIHHLQLHFFQEHSQAFENMLHLSTALAGGRFPFNLPTQLLPPFYPQQFIPTKPDNLGPTHPEFSTTELNPLHSSNLLHPLIRNTTRSEVLRPDLCGSVTANQLNPSQSQLMNFQLNAAANAFGFPFSPALIPDSISNCIQDEKRSSRLGTEKAMEYNSSRETNGGPIHLESKRARVQTSGELTHSFTQDSSSIGSTLPDTSLPPWLYNANVNSTSKIRAPHFSNPPTTSATITTIPALSRPTDYSHSSVTRSDQPFPLPPVPHFPFSDNLDLFPNVSTSMQQRISGCVSSCSGPASKLDQPLSNGSSQDDTLTNPAQSGGRTHTISSLALSGLTQSLKSDSLSGDSLNDNEVSNAVRLRPATKGTIGILSKTSADSTPTGSDGQLSMMNGIVHNTLRKTRSDMKVIHRYLVQVKHDTRDIHLIPYYELDQYIQDFVLTAKKKDGHEYEPESLKAFVHSLERHLKHHGYPHSVLKGSAFTGTRAVLNQRLNELRALSRSSGGATIGSYPPTVGVGSVNVSGKRQFESTGDSMVGSQPTFTKRMASGKAFTPVGLVQAGLLGKDNPQAILNSLWLINRTQFNIGGTQRHRNLVWGQFQLVTDDNGTKAIKFTPLFESAEVRYCRGYGGSKGADSVGRSSGSMQTLSCTGAAKRQPLPFNCVELFELYATLRPPEARGVSEPFYLCPDPGWEQNRTWFKTNAAGSQLLSKIPRLLGLKPTREPIQPNMLPIASSAQSHNDPYDMDREGMSEARDKIHPISLARSSPSLQSKVAFDRQHHPPSLGGTFPSLCPPNLPPNLLQLFPFMFPPASDCSSIPNAGSIQHPYFLPPNLYSAFSNFIPPSEHEYPYQGKVNKSGVSMEQQEADDLSRSGNVNQSGASSEQQLNTSRLQPDTDIATSSSDCTPSPTNAENLSLSNTSPMLHCPVLERAHSPQDDSTTQLASRGQTANNSAIRESYSSPNSNESQTSSRPHSATSRQSPSNRSISSCPVEHNLGALDYAHSNPASPHSAGCNIPTDKHSNWSQDVINLTHCKQEGSSCA